ncbi:MAG: hypothetical protein AB7T22_02085 [Calditrichaceae bacterium]
MKHILIFALIVVVAALFVSCGADSAGEHTHGKKTRTSYSAEDVPEDRLEGLRLDNGRKWKMDDHTRSSFAKMGASLLDSDLQALEEDGLKKAGADLQVLTDELIQGCTMTGNAHNQLHLYLSEYMPAVAALTKSGRIEDARRVRHYLERYKAYFE